MTRICTLAASALATGLLLGGCAPGDDDDDGDERDDVAAAQLGSVTPVAAAQPAHTCQPACWHQLTANVDYTTGYADPALVCCDTAGRQQARITRVILCNRTNRSGGWPPTVMRMRFTYRWYEGTRQTSYLSTVDTVERVGVGNCVIKGSGWTATSYGAEDLRPVRTGGAGFAHGSHP